MGFETDVMVSVSCGISNNKAVPMGFETRLCMVEACSHDVIIKQSLWDLKHTCVW